MEKRLIQKEENGQALHQPGQQGEGIKKKERDLDIQEEETAVLKKEVNKLYEEQRLKLEKISGAILLSRQKVKELIIKQYGRRSPARIGAKTETDR